MHGLVNRSIESFVKDTYGATVWRDTAVMTDLGDDSFEALLPYDDAITWRLLEAISAILDKPSEVVLEDLGTYLVSHPNLEPLRRLMRFGGTTFREFLYSLDDLPDRVRLAVPDLDLAGLELNDKGEGVFELVTSWGKPGFGHVLVGILRAMADDYGDLVFLEHKGGQGTETVQITLHQAEFAKGRVFDLTASARRHD